MRKIWPVQGASRYASHDHSFLGIHFRIINVPTTSGIERRYEVWRFGKWHHKLMTWRAK